MIQIALIIFIILTTLLILIIFLPRKEEKPNFDLLISNFRKQMADMETEIEKNEQTIKDLRKKINKYKRKK